MGGYLGHVVPGIAIAFWGVVWLVLTLIAHLNVKRRRTNRGARRNELRALRWEDGYKHKSWLPFPCAPRLPIEPICKIVLASLGMFVELFVDLADHETTFYWRPNNILNRKAPMVEKAQHATMYSFFILSGIMDLVTMGTCCRFPKKTGQLVFALAVWVQGTLFMFHADGHSMLDARVHFILALSVYGVAVAATARIFLPTKVFVNFALSVCLIFQGTWLAAIGFILYGPNREWWKVDAEGPSRRARQGHAFSMIASLMAAWHLLCIVVVVLVLWGVVMTVNHCGIRVLLPLAHVPGLPTCCKERLNDASRMSQTEVLYEHTKLMETDDVDATSKETETNGGIGDITEMAEIPTL